MFKLLAPSASGICGMFQLLVSPAFGIHRMSQLLAASASGICGMLQPLVSPALGIHRMSQLLAAPAPLQVAVYAVRAIGLLIF